MKNKNMGLKILIIFLSFLIVGLVGYIANDKVLTDNSNTINKNNGQYLFGDVVNISEMSSVKGFYFGGDDITDFSKWYVLSDENNIVTLYSDEVWSKAGGVIDYTDLFKEYGVIVERVRGLNEEELELFGCNLSNLTCNNSPVWAKNSITEVRRENYTIVYEGDKLTSINQTTLALVRPVIEISKDNLKNAVKDNHNENNITKEQIKNIFKIVYEYRELPVVYCGKTDNTLVEIYGVSRKKSTEFTSYDEMLDSLKKYMSLEVIAGKSAFAATTREFYLEHDDKLYCNETYKGYMYGHGNIDIEIESEESNKINCVATMELTDPNGSITYDKVNIILEKDNNNWIITSYEKQNKELR